MTRIVRPDELPLGGRVARDVLSGHAATAPLLRAGVHVTEGYRQALARAGVGGVWVDDELGDGIETTTPLDERTRLGVTNALAGAFAEVPQALASGRPLPEQSVRNLERTVGSIIDAVAGADSATLALASLASADAYTLEHSIDVTVLGLLVASRLFRQNGRIDARGGRTRSGIDAALRRLGLGLLLHDVGKVGMPVEVLQKPGPLDPDELALVQQHPQIGLSLLDTQQVSAHALAVVRWHHERFGGGGYPDGIAGDEIPQFARIAAVADVFSAMTTRRPYQEALPAHVALATITAGAGTQFDPEVVAILLEIVAPYPAGSELVLADGRRAVVVRVPAEQLDRPVVRVVADAAGAAVTPYELDLAVQPDLVPAPVTRG